MSTDDSPKPKLTRSEFARHVDYSTNAHSWSHWAQHAYAAAQALFANGNPFLWFGAAVLGHQAVEMCLKAILIGQGHRVTKGDVWGHDLIGLMKQVQDSGVRLPPELEDDFRVFNSFFNELRYPTALKEVSGFGQEEGERLRRILLVLGPFADAADKELSAARGASGE
jgi:HEPN domain-containing protein